MEEHKTEPMIQRIDPNIEKLQVRQLQKFRANRSKVKTKNALSRLGNSARKEENVLDDILRAVRAECTVGEISDTLRNVFGEYRVRHEV
jgi:methylmalonyl-CoA mutase N-terminal domain/subunit